MKTLNEEINRIKDIMLINEIGGGSLEVFMNMSFKKDREENPYMSKKYNPESETDFPNSKVTDVVWRAGDLDVFHKGGAAESKGFRGGRERLMHDLVNQGYDGIIIGEDMWNDTADPETQVYSKQYVVFNPENIKPA